MSQEKAFVVVEAVDRPAGAMLVRYQIVERVEPDPEEERLAAAPPPRPPGVDEEIWEETKAQVAAAEALYKRPTTNKPSYRTEERVLICMKPEEIAAAIVEAKEQYDEIRKLKKAGARFDFGVPGLPRF